MAMQLGQTFRELHSLLKMTNLERLSPDLAKKLVADFLMHKGISIDSLGTDQTDLLSRLAPLIARLSHLSPEDEFVTALMDGELPPIPLTDVELASVQA